MLYLNNSPPGQFPTLQVYWSWWVVLMAGSGLGGELSYWGIVCFIDLMHWRHKGSHLHNNDASLVSRSAHVLCWQCELALSLSVRGPGRASPAVWLAGFAPLAACLAMTHVAVFRLTPNAAGRPSVTSYAYGLLWSWGPLHKTFTGEKTLVKSENSGKHEFTKCWLYHRQKILVEITQVFLR